MLYPCVQATDPLACTVLCLFVACHANSARPGGNFLERRACPGHGGPKNREKFCGSNALRLISRRWRGEQRRWNYFRKQCGWRERRSAIPQITSPRTPGKRGWPPPAGGRGWACQAGLGTHISEGAGPWPPPSVRTIMVIMRHKGDHTSYVLMGDDPLAALPNNPEVRLEHCAPPS